MFSLRELEDVTRKPDLVFVNIFSFIQLPFISSTPSMKTPHNGVWNLFKNNKNTRKTPLLALFLLLAFKIKEYYKEQIVKTYEKQRISDWRKLLFGHSDVLSQWAPLQTLQISKWASLSWFEERMEGSGRWGGSVIKFFSCWEGRSFEGGTHLGRDNLSDNYGMSIGLWMHYSSINWLTCCTVDSFSWLFLLLLLLLLLL